MGMFDEENLVEIPSEKNVEEYNRDQEFDNKWKIQERITKGEIVHSDKPSMMTDPKDKSKKILKIVNGSKVYPKVPSWFKEKKSGVYFIPTLSGFPILGVKGYKLKVGQDRMEVLTKFKTSYEKGELDKHLVKWDEKRVSRNKELADRLGK